MGDDAQQMQGVGVGGLDGQDLATGRFGLLEPAGLMVAKTTLEQTLAMYILCTRYFCQRKWARSKTMSFCIRPTGRKSFRRSAKSPSKSLRDSQGNKMSLA
jgi:hypothetical protein